MKILNCTKTAEKQVKMAIGIAEGFSSIRGEASLLNDPFKVRDLIFDKVFKELGLNKNKQNTAFFDRIYASQLAVASEYIFNPSLEIESVNDIEEVSENVDLDSEDKARDESMEEVLYDDTATDDEAQVALTSDEREYIELVFPDNSEMMLRLYNIVQEEIVRSVFIDFEEGVIVPEDEVDDRIKKNFGSLEVDPEVEEEIRNSKITPELISKLGDDYIMYVLRRDYKKLLAMTFADRKRAKDVFLSTHTDESGNIKFKKVNKNLFRSSVRFDNNGVDGMEEIDNVARLLIRTTRISQTARSGYRGNYLNDSVDFFDIFQKALDIGQFDGTDHVNGIAEAVRKALESPSWTIDQRVKLQTIYDRFLSDNDNSLRAILRKEANLDKDSLYTTLLRAFSSRFPIKYVWQDQFETQFQRDFSTNTADIYENSVKTRIKLLREQSDFLSSRGIKTDEDIVISREGESLTLTKLANNEFRLEYQGEDLDFESEEIPMGAYNLLSELFEQVVGIKYDSDFMKSFIERRAEETGQSKSEEVNTIGKVMFDVLYLSEQESDTEEDDEGLKSIYRQLEAMATVYDSATNNLPKSSKVNIEGKLEALLSLQNPIYSINRHKNRIKEGSPYQYNPFMNRSTDSYMEIDSFYVRDGVIVGTDTKKSAAFSTKESLEFNSLAYADSLLNENSNGRRAIFDYAVFSDKNRNTLPLIHKEKGERFGPLGNFDRMLEEFRITQKGQYGQMLNNLSEDLFKVARELKLKDLKNAKEFRSLDPKAKAEHVNEVLTNLKNKNSKDFNEILLKAVDTYNLKEIEEYNKAIAEGDTDIEAPDEIVLFKGVNMGGVNNDLIAQYELANDPEKFSEWFNDKIIADELELLKERGINPRKLLGIQKLLESYESNESLDEDDPELAIFKKMVLDWNMVSANLLPLTQGTVYQYGDENSGFVKQTKRNVGIQSTVHPYMLGMRNGVEEKTRIAVVSDPNQILQNSHGLTTGQDIYDGSSFILFSQYIKQENSLGFLKQGMAGKSLYSINDNYRGVYTLRKHASFAMSNERLRNDEKLVNLIQKMMSDPVSNSSFRTLAERLKREFDVDQLKTDILSLLNEDIDLEFNTYDQANEWLRNQDDDTQKKLASLNNYFTGVDLGFTLLNHKFKNDYYTLEDGDAEVVDRVKLTYAELQNLNHYTLWNNYLGGLTSAHESSLTQTSVKDNAGVPMKYDNSSWISLVEFESEFPEVRGQYIQEVSLESATKTGQGNVNSASEFESAPQYDENGNLVNRLHSYLQSNVGGGIQLTAEHDPDDNVGHLTGPTQAISSVAFGSRTPEFSTELYDTLAQYSIRNLDKYFKYTNDQALKSNYEENRIEVYNLVRDLVQRAMLNQSGTVSLADVMISRKGGVPFDNAQIMNKTIATVNSDITKLGIRFKLQGGQFVVAPPTDQIHVVIDSKTGKQVKISKQQYDSDPERFGEPIAKRRFRQEFVEVFDAEGKAYKDFEFGPTRTLFRMNLLETTLKGLTSEKRPWGLSKALNTLLLASEPYADEQSVKYLSEFSEIGDLVKNEEELITILEKVLKGEEVTIGDRKFKFQPDEEIASTKNIFPDADQWSKKIKEASTFEEKKKIVFGAYKDFYTNIHDSNVSRTEVDGETGIVTAYDENGNIVYKSYPGEAAMGYHHRSKFLIGNGQILEDVDKDFFAQQFREGLEENREYSIRRRLVISKLAERLQITNKDASNLYRATFNLKDKIEVEPYKEYSEDDDGYVEFVEDFNKQYLEATSALERGRTVNSLAKYYKALGIRRDVTLMTEAQIEQEFEKIEDNRDGMDRLRRHIPDPQNSTPEERSEFIFFRNLRRSQKTYEIKANIPKWIKESMLFNVDQKINKVEDLKEFLMNTMAEIIDEQSSVLLENFRASLHTMIPRIPSQSYQSTAVYRTVFFLDEGSNLLQEPVESLWRKGQDYDIDKGNVFGYTFNRDATIDTTGSEGNLYERLSAPVTEESSNNAILNRAIYFMYRAFIDPRNQYLSQYPIDMDTMNEAKEKSSKGQAEKKFTKNSMVAQAIMREANMVGKAVIGVEANYIKHWSAQTMSLQKALQNIEDLQYAVGTKKFNNKDWSFANINPKLIRRDIQDSEQRDKYKRNLYKIFPNNISDIDSIIDLSAKEVLTEDEQKRVDQAMFELKFEFNTQEQADTILSQFLSAATDNAKELILGKINATVLTTPMMSAMATMGIDFLQIVDFMITPEVETIIEFAQKNIYEKGAYVSPKDVAKAISKPENKKQKDFQDEILAYFSKKYNKEFEVNLAEQFLDWFLVGEEATVSAKILGINQGMPSDAEGMINYIKNIEVFIDGKIREKVGNENLSQGKIFDFYRFVRSLEGNDEYAQKMIEMYDVHKEAINIPYIIKSVPNFRAMMESVFTAKEIYSKTMYSWKMIDNLLRKIEVANKKPEGQKLLKGQASNIIQFMDDYMIDIFLREEGGVYYYDGEGNRHDIKDNKSRKKFIDWIESDFFVRLKESEEFSKNPFVSDLFQDQRKDYETGEEYSVWKLLYNISNTASARQTLQSNTYRDGLKKLVGKAFDGNDVFKMLFLYNLITSRHSMKRESFTRLMDFAVKDPKPSTGVILMNKWLDFQHNVATLTPVELALRMGLDDPQLERSMLRTLMLQYGFARQIYQNPENPDISFSEEDLENYPEYLFYQSREGRQYYHNTGKSLKLLNKPGQGLTNFISRRYIGLSASPTALQNFAHLLKAPVEVLPKAEEVIVVESKKTTQSDYSELLDQYFKDCPKNDRDFTIPF